MDSKFISAFFSVCIAFGLSSFLPDPILTYINWIYFAVDGCHSSKVFYLDGDEDEEADDNEKED